LTCEFVDQITQSDAATYPGLSPIAPIKAKLPEHEPGLVDKLIELWKLFGGIKKVKNEIVKTGKSKGVNTNVAPMTARKRWSSLIYNNQFAPRFQEIEKSIETQLSKIQYDNMIITYNLLRICFGRQYDMMVNHTLWVSFLEPLLKGSRYNQMVIVLLVRALVNYVNKEIWRSFLDRKCEIIAAWDDIRKKKEESAKLALKQASKPASLQIKEQVSSEVDLKLKQTKRKGQNQAGLKEPAKFQKVPGKDKSGRNRPHDMTFKRQRYFDNRDRNRSRSPDYGFFQSRGSYYVPRELHHEQGYTGSRAPPPPSGYASTDPYSIHRAPMHIFENQVIPVQIHNLSKTCVPNLVVNRILSMGTKFAPTKVTPVWSDIFENFKDIRRELKNKMFFT
jgi:hypothetical protein